MNIYVGNLPRDLTREQLEAAFAAHGQVESVSIITDRATGESRGFGFIEMQNDQEGQTAIDALNGQDLGGRVITVSVARPREERRGGGGGGGRGGRGGGRGGGGGGGNRGGGGGRRW